MNSFRISMNTKNKMKIDRYGYDEFLRHLLWI